MFPSDYAHQQSDKVWEGRLGKESSFVFCCYLIGKILLDDIWMAQRYSSKTSGWFKADFQLPETILVISPSKPIFMPHSMPWSSLLHHAWSGWFARYLWNLLWWSGDWATKTTLGSRVLLLTVVADMCSFAIGKCASVQLEVITALSATVEPFVQL